MNKYFFKKKLWQFSISRCQNYKLDISSKKYNEDIFPDPLE